MILQVCPARCPESERNFPKFETWCIALSCQDPAGWFLYPYYFVIVITLILNVLQVLNLFLMMTYQRSELFLNGAQSDENGNDKDALHNSKILLSQLLANASTPSFHEIYALGPAGSEPILRKTHKCCVYIANKSKYCARLNSIQAFSDINRDVSFHSWSSSSALSFFFPCNGIILLNCSLWVVGTGSRRCKSPIWLYFFFT